MKYLQCQFKSPSYHLVFETAKRNWWLIILNLVTNVLSALLEGSTLGIVYLAVSYLSHSDQTTNTHSEKSAFFQWLSNVLPLPSEQVFLALIGCAVLLQLLLSLSNYINKVSIAYLSAKAQPYVTGKIFEQIMRLSYGCVSRFKIGDLMLFTTEASAAVDLQITEINNIIVGLTFSLAYIVVIIQLSPLLAGAASILTLIAVSIQYKLIPRLQRTVRQVVETRVDSAKYITESLQGLRLVHTFGKQIRTVSVTYDLLKKTQFQLEKRAFLLYLPEPVLDIIPMLALGILASISILFNPGQNEILPTLLTFLLALQRLSVRLKIAVVKITRLTDNSAQMLRIDSILDRNDKIFEISGIKQFKGLHSNIDFENVSLSYGNDLDYAINSLTFTIPRNQITALVGGSGAGKSSIVDLLLGLYQPTSGRIRVNSQCLTDYSLEEWRQYIGVVSQDTFIFNTSIFENLRYGSPNASLDEVTKASELAQAHEFIVALPEGYSTIVGERGYKLSGGQKQRLALARALVKQPEILILDEATSALDSESEKLIQQALKRFQRERTVIVIAHRLSTISEADQILVLEGGKIVEKGNHQMLLRKDGRYAEYWRLQSRQLVA